MKCFVSTLLFLSLEVMAIVATPNLPAEGVVLGDNNNFIDPKVDYSNFMGRVTDRNNEGTIFKVHVENDNTKFFKAGGVVYFKVNNQDTGKFCRGSLRTIEDNYFSLFVQDFAPCWQGRSYIPRGIQINFFSRKLADRVFEASKYREILILRKEGFLKQLAGINKFIWTFDQQRLKVAADYDQRINDLLREKQLAIDNLIQKKQESLLLQTELKSKLKTLDESLDHYKIERQEFIKDRWAMDHDLDLPVGRRPMEPKQK